VALSFNGHLLYLKIGNSYQPFPNSYIELRSWSSTPRQRLELKADRNSSGDLKRVTAPKFKTSLSFQTHTLHLAEMAEVRSLFNRAFVIPNQRKLIVKYWDDELMAYRSDVQMYMPDTQYPIIDINSRDRDILYGSTTFEFVEY